MGYFSVSSLFTEISQKKGKLNKNDPSNLEKVFLGSLLGNNNACFLASVDGRGNVRRLVYTVVFFVILFWYDYGTSMSKVG